MKRNITRYTLKQYLYITEVNRQLEERNVMNQERTQALRSLRTAKGQIEGIIKMLEDDRYCVDISNQIVASQALLKKANMLILRQHIHHCVKDAMKREDGEEKVDEIIEILDKLIQK